MYKRQGFLCGFQLVADGFTGSGLLRDGVVDGSPGILHIGADILDALRKADGAVLVLDVGQPDFISGKDVYKRQMQLCETPGSKCLPQSGGSSMRSTSGTWR